jgi:ABC-type enterobactin transport system permease subunit
MFIFDRPFRAVVGGLCTALLAVLLARGCGTSDDSGASVVGQLNQYIAPANRFVSLRAAMCRGSASRPLCIPAQLQPFPS